MNGLIILTSMLFVSYIIFKITKHKIAKYILSPIIGVLYGFMLFFIGMGINGVIYIILAALPVVIGVIYMLKQHYINKN